jgi:transposase
MSEIITVGLDLAKNVFQTHGADASGRCWMSLRTDPALSSRFDPPFSMSVGS